MFVKLLSMLLKSDEWKLYSIMHPLHIKYTQKSQTEVDKWTDGPSITIDIFLVKTFRTRRTHCWKIHLWQSTQLFTCLFMQHKHQVKVKIVLE